MNHMSDERLEKNAGGESNPPGNQGMWGVEALLASGDYPAAAQEVIKRVRCQIPREKLTTTKIRNILSMVSDVYNEVLLEPSEELSDTARSKLLRMKVRLIYECGREVSENKNKNNSQEQNPVETFINEAKLMQQLEKIGGSRAELIRFYYYMEALVAYHRFEGGKD